MHYFCYFWKKVTKEHNLGAHRSWKRINTLCNHFKHVLR